MLLTLAATVQVLLVAELLRRLLLYLFIPAKRTSIQSLADNSVLSSLATAVLQAATVPLQEAASLLASGTRISVRDAHEHRARPHPPRARLQKAGQGRADVLVQPLHQLAAPASRRQRVERRQLVGGGRGGLARAHHTEDQL